jgi:hypothetical protein
MITETKTNVHFHIDKLNLGNNFAYSHFIGAIKENETAMNDVDELGYIDTSKELIITANLKYNYTLKDTFDLSEFLDSF